MRTFIIVNYNCNTFIVQATGVNALKNVVVIIDKLVHLFLVSFNPVWYRLAQPELTIITTIASVTTVRRGLNYLSVKNTLAYFSPIATKKSLITLTSGPEVISKKPVNANQVPLKKTFLQPQFIDVHSKLECFSLRWHSSLVHCFWLRSGA